MLASRSSLGQRMQEEEQCAATLTFRHYCNQSGWLIPIINRPGVAGAVLQTALSFVKVIDVCGNIFQRLSIPDWKS